MHNGFRLTLAPCGYCRAALYRAALRCTTVLRGLSCYNYPPLKGDVRIPTFISVALGVVWLGRLELRSPTLIKTSPALCTAGGPIKLRSGVKRVADLANSNPRWSIYPITNQGEQSEVDKLRHECAGHACEVPTPRRRYRPCCQRYWLPSACA